MSNSDSLSILASIFRPDQNDARPTILLGAGASFSSGIPMAGECVRRIAKRVYADRHNRERIAPERLKPSEWQSWLSSHDWFIDGAENLADNFPLAVQHLLTPQAYRRSVMMDLIHHEGVTSQGYSSLANLVTRGLAGSILTTNFDACLPNALREKHPHIRHVFESNRSPGDFNEFDLYARAQIVWLHGKAEQYTDCNLIEEVSSLAPKLLDTLRPLLESTPLVVVGYRGAEASIMKDLLGEESSLAFRKGVFWCRMKSEPFHPNAVALQDRLGANFHDIEIDGFDRLFNELDTELKSEKRYFDSAPQGDDVGFDDEVCNGASWADIDADLALAILKDYADKVGPSDLKSDSLKPFMRDLGLLLKVEGFDTPTNGAILLFGRDTNRFFPWAIVSATVGGKKRQIFGGNLINQRKELLAWLEDKDVNPTLTVKQRSTHEQRSAYADRALIELAINLLVHRDYSLERPARVDAQESVGIVFENPGQKPKLSDRLSLDSLGAFTPVPEFSSLRNRTICDVFFGMSAMERSGTGLVDVQEMASEHGGAAEFAYPSGTDNFRAKLLRMEASAGSATIARATGPIGTYTVNMLPVSSIPETLQLIPVKASWSDLERKCDLHEAGTFLLDRRAGLIRTFMPAVMASLIFEPVMTGPIEERNVAEADEDIVLQRQLSWLIRKHFEAYLTRFKDDGLILERTKKNRPAKRAYFTGDNGEPRNFIYDSASRRGVSRGVAKLREVGKHTWFECEGFGYEVVKTLGGWGVRIKPYYMFTKTDGVTPLPGYLRTKKSTSRFKFDRNGSVDSDLNFWERFISDGMQIINLGGQFADDLLLRGEFYRADVEEKGLLKHDSATQNKRTA